VDLKYAYVVFHQLPSYVQHTLGGVYQVPHLWFATLSTEAGKSGTALRTASNLPSNHSFDTRSTNA